MKQKLRKFYMTKLKTKKVYVCGVDWQHELGEVSDYTKVYSTVEDLKRQRSCWEECGIVELEVKMTKWMEPQNLFKNIKK